MPNLSDLNKSHIDIIRDELNKFSFITKDNIEYQTEKGHKEFNCDQQGYVDNIYMEGKTLVNLCYCPDAPDESPGAWYQRFDNRISGYDTYTVIIPEVADYIGFEVYNANGAGTNYAFAVDHNVGFKVVNIPTDHRIATMYGGKEVFTKDEIRELTNKIMIIPGDHSDIIDQISYFSGISSIGQDGTIELVTTGENLFNKDMFVVGSTNSITGDIFSIDNKTNRIVLKEPLPIESYEYYNLDYKEDVQVYIYQLDKDKRIIAAHSWKRYEFARSTYEETKYFQFIFSYIDGRTLTIDDYDKMKIVLSKRYSFMHFENARLNSAPSGACDTIIKSNAGYLKVRKCNQIYINGASDITEIYRPVNNGVESTTHVRVRIQITDAKTEASTVYCDRFKSVINYEIEEKNIFVCGALSCFFLTIPLSELSSVNATGVNQWLNAHPFTVVYERQRIELVELENDNPIVFEGNNRFIVNSGPIQGECAFEITNGLKNNLEIIQDRINDINKKIDKKTDNVQKFKLTKDNGYNKTITSGSFNDIVTPGIYTIGHEVTDGPFSGYKGWYHLEVIADSSKWAKQTATIFEATGYGTRMYIRGMQNGTWAPWREFIDSSVETKVNSSQLSKITSDWGHCINIRGQDLNTATPTNGNYMGDNLTNAPSSNWYYVEVFVHNNNYQMQRLTDLHDSAIVWTRQQISGNWSNWVCL